MFASALILIAFMATQENSDTATPAIDEVISTMMQKEADRRTAFGGYSGIRTYVLENEAYHKRAEMTVRIACHPDGTKEFGVLSSVGWGGARKHVFSKLLEAEAAASKPGSGDE